LHVFFKKARFSGVYSLRYLTALSTLETTFAFNTKTKRRQQNLLQKTRIRTDSNATLRKYLIFNVLQPD
jgi:hypothetical protein